MAVEGLHEVAELIDQLRSSTTALRQLQRVSVTLGPVRTRDELIPYVTDSLEDDDEVLVVLAEELGRLLDFVGGSPHADCLLRPLEQLCGTDENAVRDAAVAAIQTIASAMTAADVTALLLPRVVRMAQGCYTSRVAACALLADLHPSVPEPQRAEVRRHFGELTRDATPIVRRAAAANMSRMVQVIDSTHIPDLLAVLVAVCQDAQESVRRAVVDHIAPFARCCAQIADDALKAACLEELLTQTIDLMGDRTWRVRYCIAHRVHDIAQEYGPPVTRARLFKPYMVLLSDDDADVRAPACIALPVICSHIEQPVFLSALLPRMLELAQDASENVRTSLAGHVVQLAPLLGRQCTIEHLLELYLRLLRDNTPGVRLNVLSNLYHLNDIITLDQMSEALLPTVDELARDRSWRVRHSLVAMTPRLAQQLGVVFFQRELVQRSLLWLTDSVADIRKAASAAICEVAQSFGQEWTNEHVLSRVAAMMHDSSYLFRVSVLHCLRDMSAAVSTDAVAAGIVPVCITATSDAVPNVRFTAVRVLQALRPLVQPMQAQVQVLPCLRELFEGDQDRDVKFFTGICIHAYENGADLG